MRNAGKLSGLSLRADILCAHCAAQSAAAACPGCRLEICERCAADRTSCPDPRALEIRLGLGGRLRAVDPSGRWGLATTLRGSLVRIDLDRLERERLATQIGSPQILPGGELSGLATAGSDVLGYDHGTRRFRGIYSGRLDRSCRSLVGFGSSEVWIYHLDDAPVAGLEPTKSQLKPFRRAAPSAAAYDRAADRLACATYGEIVVWAMRDREIVTTLEIEGRDIDWVAITGDRVAALLSTGGVIRRDRYDLAVWSVDSRDELARAPLGRPRRPLADLSGDGAIAIAANDASELVVVDLESGEIRRLDGHSDGLSALRVSDDGRRLVSGDFDNRVIVRDRGSRGYPTGLEPAELVER